MRWTAVLAYRVIANGHLALGAALALGRRASAIASQSSQHRRVELAGRGPSASLTTILPRTDRASQSAVGVALADVLVEGLTPEFATSAQSVARTGQPSGLLQAGGGRSRRVAEMRVRFVPGDGRSWDAVSHEFSGRRLGSSRVADLVNDRLPASARRTCRHDLLRCVGDPGSFAGSRRLIY
jgi:hypothetical protein